MTDQRMRDLAELAREVAGLDRPALIERLLALETVNLDLRCEIAGLRGDIEVARENEKQARIDLRNATKGA